MSGAVADPVGARLNRVAADRHQRQTMLGQIDAVYRSQWETRPVFLGAGTAQVLERHLAALRMRGARTL